MADIYTSDMFLRFKNINIPRWYQLFPESILLNIINKNIFISDSTSEIILDIYINEIGNVLSTPSDILDYNSLILSTPIQFKLPKSFTDLNIDVTSLVQKILYRDDWDYGNSIMFILKSNVNNVPFHLNIYDFSDNPDNVATLWFHVDNCMSIPPPQLEWWVNCIPIDEYVPIPDSVPV